MTQIVCEYDRGTKFACKETATFTFTLFGDGEYYGKNDKSLHVCKNHALTLCADNARGSYDVGEGVPEEF